MKVAVFGANGQLGHCFQDIEQGCSSREYFFFDKAGFNIVDPNAYALLDNQNIDLMINCAAYTAVDRAETDRDNAYQINVTGPKLLAAFALKNNIPLIHFSTDYVYAPSTKPIDESHNIAPVNFYGQTKWEGEEAIRNSGAKYLIFRTSWLYSEHGNNFVKTMLRLAESRNELRVVNDQTGSPTYAYDLVLAIDSIIHTCEIIDHLPQGTYNFANKGSATWYGFACEVLKDKKVNLIPISSEEYPTAAERPTYSVLSSTKFEERFDWQIQTWEDSLSECRKGLHKK